MQDGSEQEPLESRFAPGGDERAVRRRSLPAHRAETLRVAAPIVVLVIASAISRLALPRLDRSDFAVASVALTLDFTVTVPALVYLLLVRSRRAPWIVMLPAFAAGYVMALVMIPHRQPEIPQLLRWGVVPVEIALLGCLVVLGRRALRSVPHES